MSGSALDAVALLLRRFGSVVVDDTVAVFEKLPRKDAGTLNVALIVTDCPLLRVPRLHGKGVVQAPEFETNVRLAGVGSDTVTPAAWLGPLFVTLIPASQLACLKKLPWR